MTTTNTPATRLATRLVFLVAGFGIACWAPMVPLLKSRLDLSEASLGLLLLCIGFGSLGAMLLTGVVAARIGSRPVILASGAALALMLPVLACAHTALLLGVFLFAFGAAMGSLDVAVNLHAVEVEKGSDRPLMSGFHAQFSLGAFLGAGIMTLLLSLRLSLLAACILGAAMMLAAVLLSAPGLLRDRPPSAAGTLALPRGKIWLIAVLTAIAFLAEGGILDWSALLLIGMGKVQQAHGGLGYMLFAIAMVAGRLGGDALAMRFGDCSVLRTSGLLSVCGFVVLLAVSNPVMSLSGFIWIGLGLANVVPVLFRRAGQQQDMPPALAIAAVTTTGYAGILLGPALLGLVAQWLGLAVSFAALAVLLMLVVFSAKVVSRSG